LNHFSEEHFLIILRGHPSKTMFKSRFISIFLLFLSVAVIPAAAQKVKYKDIYPLLSTKQYDQAEPFLKTYLKENLDNSNAFLFMGTIYQEKIAKDDILLQTEKAIQHMDSAILYYDKALKLLTEKELKKNKEFYESYNKRDMATGEFGVKLDYVHFDLEKRITALKEQIDKITMVKHYFTNAENLYKRSQDLFSAIQAGYPGYRELYLRADESTVKNLSSLSLRFDSCTKAFENYKISLSNYGKTKYNQKWTLREIEDFKTDGKEITDFYKDDVKVWNYKAFADEALAIIEKDVKPVQDNLVKFDMEINKLKTRLETDSISVKSDLIKLADGGLGGQLKKFDTSPLPLDIFAMKIADLEYKSTIIENKKVHASEDVHLRLNAVKDELKYLNRADSASKKLSARNLDEDIINYQQFVTTTFTKGDILKSYVHSMNEHFTHEKAIKDAELKLRTDAMNWLVNGTDSIPLFTQPARLNKHRPLVVVQDKYTAGLTFMDSVSGSGYFYNIPPSHKPDIKVQFAIDKLNLREKKLPAIHSFITEDPAAQIFFALIYLERKDKNGKYPATVAKIYKSDGLSWSNNFTFDFIPTEINFVPDTGELIVKSGGDASVRVDKNGKVIK
jgi:tetratricopeptide (TPR) repeat protein